MTSRMFRVTLVGVLVAFGCRHSDVFAAEIDYAALRKQLKNDGLVGRLHASIPELGLYIFTWRDRDDFFTYAEFPLVTDIVDIQAALDTLRRHDKVQIQGDFLENKAPIHHIRLTGLKVLKRDEAPDVVKRYSYSTKLPDDLKGKDSAILKVHALLGEGHVVVTEYRDAVIPLVVLDANLTKDLFRGDKIKVFFTLSDLPEKPVHLRLAKEIKQPMQVLSRLKDLHEKALTLTGPLVLYPKSSDINTYVFALDSTDADGISNTFTLVDKDSGTPVHGELDHLFLENIHTVKNGRNKLILPGTKITVSGIANVVDPNQANPQLLIQNPAKDISWTKEKKK